MSDLKCNIRKKNTNGNDRQEIKVVSNKIYLITKTK